MSIKSFWENCINLTFQNEADVETRLIIPMLEALNYNISEDITSKYPINFKIYEGRRGRRPEADLVVFSGLPHCKATSLITVEAKHPKEKLISGKEQAESYAQNLRTPFLLYSNGYDLELWQLQTTTNCKLILKISQNDYLKKRGELEAYISKEAAIHHCKNLEFKNFNISMSDFHPYETAEYKRINNLPPSISRNLFLTDDNQTQSANIRELILDNKHSLILAQSGFGKSILAEQICNEALSLRFENTSAALPILLFAPDLAFSKTSIKKYVLDRLTPYLPQISDSNLHRIINEQGLLLIFDGMNRIDNHKQHQLKSELQSLIRDYPRLKCIILSSQNIIFESLPFKNYHLEEFDDIDFKQLAKIYSTSNQGIDPSWYNAPYPIKEMAKIPVLSTKIIDIYHKTSKFPQQLHNIFEHWIDRATSQLGNIERANAITFLEHLAELTRDNSIPVQKMQQLSKSNGIKPFLLDKIINTGLINITGKSVEIIHETLGTYLRANALIEKSEKEIKQYFAKNITKENHLFSAILMSLSQNEKQQNLIWSKLLKHDFLSAISSLHYSLNKTSNNLTINATENSKEILIQIYKNFTKPIELHFKPHSKKLFRIASGYDTAKLGITGDLKDSMVSFAFFDRNSNNKKILVSKNLVQGQRVWHGRSIDLDNSLRNNGRIIGLKQLKNCLIELIKTRRIIGDKTWLEDRCLGRFMYLAQEYDETPLQGEVKIHNAIELLNPQKENWVAHDQNQKTIYFQISELISDLEKLKQLKIYSLKPWWIEDSDINLSSKTKKKQYAKMINTYFLRAQTIYFELIKQFQKTKQFMPNAQNMPHRYSVRVEQSKHRDKGFNWYSYPMPVATIDEAGADVFFEKNQSFFEIESRFDFYEKYLKKLESTNRPTTHGRFSYNMGAVPNFTRADDPFEDARCETAAMSLAYKWLEDDIKYLFAELPKG